MTVQSLRRSILRPLEKRPGVATNLVPCDPLLHTISGHILKLRVAYEPSSLQ